MNTHCFFCVGRKVKVHRRWNVLGSRLLSATPPRDYVYNTNIHLLLHLQLILPNSVPTMSTPTAAQMTSYLTAAFLDEAREATTSFLKFFDCHRLTLTSTDDSKVEERQNIETMAWEKAVTN